MPSGRPRRGLLRSLGMLFRACIFFVTITVFWFGAFVFAWSVVPASRLLVPSPARRRRLIQHLVSRCFRALHWVLATLRLYRCRWIGGPLPETAAVLVANHPSLLDFTAIAAYCPTLCCVVKPLLMGNPFVGPLLRACGHVDGRSTSFAASERLRELRARLDDGHPVLIFPEGTRSPPGGLHPVRRGAFTLAIHAQVPVRTLFLDCHPAALGKAVSIWEYPHEEPVLTLEVTDVLDPTGRTAGSLRDQFETIVRGRMAALARPRHGGGIAA
jgi:1-acyl-sn-glycerol-3-phosphate acyltransferase